MKKLIIILFLFFHFSAFTQKVKPIHSKIAILTDSVTSYTYILDTSHTYITALNSKRDTIWTTDVSYRSFLYEDSDISYIWFAKNPGVGIHQEGKGEKAIWVGFGMCSSFIVLKNGKYYHYGCD